MRHLSTRRFWTAAVVATLALPLALAWAQDAEKKAKPIKIGGPYGKLDLSEEQRQQIKAIQEDIRAKIAAIKAEEKQRIEAVLTDKQKTQLDAMAREGRRAREDAKDDKNDDKGDDDKPRDKKKGSDDAE